MSWIIPLAKLTKVSGSIAAEYDPTQSYTAGQFAMVDGVLYKATASTSGEFDPTKWTATPVTDNLGGGGGEPAAYIKSAAVSEDGKTLTLYNKNNVPVAFSLDGKTMNFKGFLNYMSELPEEGNSILDVYIVLYQGTEGTIFFQRPFIWLTGAPGVIPPTWWSLVGNPVTRVNSNEPDQYGNLTLNSVPFATGILSDRTQEITESFIARTTGGSVSISARGDAFLAILRGGLSHVGRVPASMVVTPYPTEGSDFGVSVDQAIFATKFPLGVLATFTYTADGWTLSDTVVDLTEYGAEVYGTPLVGDYFTAAYTPANPGVITPAVFSELVSTGNNLYNDLVGYARTVGAYTNDYGIIGAYTSLAWAETPDGDTTEITVEDGKFNLTDIANGKDGYIIVTGGDDTTTMIWQCWTDMPTATFEEYEETSVEIPTLTTVFTDGVMCAVGDVADEIDYNRGMAIQRIGIIPFDPVTLQQMLTAGITLDYDLTSIYYVLDTPITESFTSVNQYVAYDHGIEYFADTTVPLTADVIYGVNIVAYILHDLQQKPKSESYTIPVANWTALSGKSPFTVSAQVTSQYASGENVVCELVNDQAVLFANHGFAIGTVVGNTVTFYALSAPTANVTLEVEYYD